MSIKNLTTISKFPENLVEKMICDLLHEKKIIMMPDGNIRHICEKCYKKYQKIT
jgi:hypothetical protein